MVIRFDLPETAAQLLLRLSGCIGAEVGAAPDVNEICKSFVIDILVDDAAEIGRAHV